MRLNAESFGAGEPALVIAHGLLGSARNWGALARRLGRRRRVIAVDMRNHGDSPWNADASYAAMAGDLAETIAAEAGGRADVLGHSMGGKAAMALALTRPERVGRLIVADIAPVGYDHSHAQTLAAMAALDLAAVSRRAEADAALRPGIPNEAMRAFVVHNLAFEDGRARWRPNIAALAAGMEGLVGWPKGPWTPFAGPTLFVRGGASDYVTPAMRGSIRALFPGAEIETLEGAGHWLHAERPEPFLATVEAFLAA
jgi:pimeloyl-ACP methyl ester carboxylesterase